MELDRRGRAEPGNRGVDTVPCHPAGGGTELLVDEGVNAGTRQTQVGQPLRRLLPHFRLKTRRALLERREQEQERSGGSGISFAG